MTPPAGLGKIRRKILWRSVLLRFGYGAAALTAVGSIYSMHSNRQLDKNIQFQSVSTNQTSLKTNAGGSGDGCDGPGPSRASLGTTAAAAGGRNNNKQGKPGEEERGGAVAAAAAAATAPPWAPDGCQTVLFFHIPKTGGESLNDLWVPMASDGQKKKPFGWDQYKALSIRMMILLENQKGFLVNRFDLLVG